MEEDRESIRYWCHQCTRPVVPILGIETVKCSSCNGEFVEEMSSVTADHDHQEIGSDSDRDRALSLWAPILLGMMNNPRRARRFRHIEFDNDDEEGERVPYSIAEEGFRHNHDECVKQQKKSFDFNEFLQAIGHENDRSFQSVSNACKPLPRKPMKDNSFMIFQMDEMAEDQAFGSPICRSPKSPKMSSMSFLDYNTDFILTGSP